MCRLSPDGLPNFLAKTDGDKRHPRVDHLLRREARGEEDVVAIRRVDDQCCKCDFKENTDVQLHVRQAVLTERFMVCRCREGSGDLTNHKCVIVQSRSHLVSVDLLRRELGPADIPEDPRGCEVRRPTTDHLHDAHVTVSVNQDTAIHDLLYERVPRLSAHESALLRLPSVSNRCPNVRANVDGQHLRDIQGKRHASQLKEVRDALRNFGAQCIGDGLLQILGRQAALLDAMDDGSELVVEEDNIGSIFRYLGAAHAHGHTDVRLLKCWRVVDAVACHGHDVPVDLAVGALAAPLLERLHDKLLVDWRDPREHAGMHDNLSPERLQLFRFFRAIVNKGLAGRNLVCELLVGDNCERRKITLGGNDGDLLGNGNTCVGMVAGNHNHFDASGLAILDGLLDPFLRWVLDTEEADKNHVRQEVLLGIIHRRFVPIEGVGKIGPALGDAEHAPGAAHELLRARVHRVQHLRRHLLHRVAVADVRELAELDHPLGGAFQGKQLATRGVGLRDEHELVRRVERYLEKRRVVHDVLDFVEAPCANAGLHQRDLRRRSDVFARAVDDGGVIADGTAKHLRGEPRLVRRVRPREVRLRDHAASGCEVDHVAERHVTRGQGARLIGANHGHTAQSLHGVQLPHEHIPCRHLLRGDHERDRHCGDEALGHLSEERAGGVRDDVPDRVRVRVQNVGDEGEQPDDYSDHRNQVNEVLDLDFKRRLRPRGLDAAGNLPQEGVVADEENHACRVPLDHCRAVEREVP
mmetsp:Transcript_18333/g.52379  ORF Transcript_18333/g.52379 Transcript_18333/m.52379 type:complete len:752 (+) Transcript_18333:190-2445(+)